LSSTGPTSRAGKNRVRWNSYNHGLLAKALFLRPIDGEDHAEFYRFFNDLRRDLQPAGMLEEMHVEGAAVRYWLIQRSLRCEGGEIKRSQLKRSAPGAKTFSVRWSVWRQQRSTIAAVLIGVLEVPIDSRRCGSGHNGPAHQSPKVRRVATLLLVRLGN
jgi:hypothetical protein